MVPRGKEYCFGVLRRAKQRKLYKDKPCAPAPLAENKPVCAKVGAPQLGVRVVEGSYLKSLCLGPGNLIP